MGIDGIQKRIDPTPVVQSAVDSEAVRQQKEPEAVKKVVVKANETAAATVDIKQRIEPEKKESVLNKSKENSKQVITESEDKKILNTGTSAKFSYNKKIDRIIITISDNASDKVIKEIPPEDTQKMLEKIHVMTGMVMDEGI